MNRPHSPWPLFSADLSLARTWVRSQLETSPVDTRLGHIALNLGMDSEVRSILQRQLPLEASAAAQWKFRLARLDGARNPYAHLVPPNWQEQAAQAIAIALEQREPLVVELNGGLGDHLEALSLLLPWGHHQRLQLKLRTSPERRLQFAELSSLFGPLHWSDGAGIPVMAIRHYLCNGSVKFDYQRWITPGTSAAPADEQPAQGLLCCWRAAGAGDRLSAHSRSVPFELVLDFYRRTLTQQPGLPITDITLWQPWEQLTLASLGIQRHDPRQGSLEQLTRYIRTNRVITIDTALAHLCAALGAQATMLLPRFSDERWNELLQRPNIYGKKLRVRHSSQFGSWAALMEALDCSAC